ncbi:MAG TPA: hypothetical protein VMC83_36640 [Streptosporangiaceae bacterium]|nr:hypothetical protein [Streptosporangiaceae bacterium]
MDTLWLALRSDLRRNWRALVSLLVLAFVRLAVVTVAGAAVAWRSR